MISERISDDIPPQIKILNMVIPILMHYWHFPFKKTVTMYFVAPTSRGCQLHKTACQLHIVTCQPVKATLHFDVLFVTVYRRIYCSKSMTLSNQTSRCICKCIRIYIYLYLTTTLLQSALGSQEKATEVNSKSLSRKGDKNGFRPTWRL